MSKSVPRLMTIQEAAQFLRVHPKTLRRWEAQGLLIPIRTLGNQRRYTQEQLDSFIRPTPNFPSLISNFRLSKIQKSLITASSLATLISLALILTSTFKPQFLASRIKHPASNSQVLASQTVLADLTLAVNIPAKFAKDITAPNVLYSLTAGTGVTLTGGAQSPTISVADQTTNVKTFKTVKVGSTTFDAGSNTDTLTLAAGDNVSLTANTSDKKVTISSSAPSVGITDDGSIVRLTSASDLFGIGTSTGSAKLSLESSDGRDILTASSAGNILLKLSQSGTLTLSTALPTTSGGTGLSTLGTEGQILAISGSAPAWIDNSSAVNYWQRALGALAPSNITDDLAIGGTATSSAKFQVFGTTGSATMSGNLTLAAAGVIATTSMQTLTLGDANTGNIATAKNILATGTLTGLTGLTVSSGTVSLPNGQIDNVELANSSITFAGNSGSGAISLGGTLTVTGGGINNAVYSGGTITVTGTEADTLAAVTGRGATTSTLVGLNGGLSSSGAVVGKALVILNETGDQDILVASASGANRLTLSNSGNLTVTGNITAANFVPSGGSGTSGYIQRNAGTVSPANITDDILVGGTSTASAAIRLSGIENDLLLNGKVSLKTDSNLTDSNATFVYDTSTDLDGGTWTVGSAAQASSWYNETLSSSTRGNTRAFPKRTVLVATNSTLLIYDATDNSLWMKFTRGTGYSINGTSVSLTSVFALNGIIYVGTSTNGLLAIDFIADRVYQYDYNAGVGGKATFQGSIADRNSNKGYGSRASWGQIASDKITGVFARLIAGKLYVATTTPGGTSVINVSDSRVVRYID